VPKILLKFIHDFNLFDSLGHYAMNNPPIFGGHGDNSRQLAG